MKLKKVLSGFLSAAILATTTAIVMPLEASAEDTTIREIGPGEVALSELTNVTKAKITFNITVCDDSAYATMTAYVNGDPWTQHTYATATQYQNGDGQSWQANEKVTGTGEQSVTLVFSPASWGYGVGLKTDNPDGLTGKLTKVEFLDASNNVVKAFDAAAPSISANNFKFSEMSNTDMAVGDFFTLTFDSEDTPEDAKFNFKYKIPKTANADPNNSSDYNYFAPIENNVATTQGQTETGLKVTSSTEGTKTIYKFEAIAASTVEFPFALNVEVSRKGDWSDTDYNIWLGDTSFYVPQALTVPVKSVAISGTGVANKKLSLEKGKDATLTATVTPADTTEEKTVTWATSNNKVATVKDGVVTAVGAGTADITVTTDGKNADSEAVTDTVTVTVTKKVIAITGVTLDKTTATVEEGKTVTLTAIVVPADTTEDKTVTWKSSDETVATVKDGVVTAVKAGTANITATAGGKTATCAVTVTAKAEDPKPSGNALWEGTQDMTWSDSIQIAKEKFADLKAGDTIEITVTKAASGAQISLKSMGEGWPALPAFNKIDPQWGCDNISKADTYKYVMTEDDVKVLKADGMVVGGHDYTVTSVKLVAAAEEPIEKTEYETGKAETVKDYVPKETPAAGTKTELKVNSISTADAAKYSSYDITITVTLKDGSKKTATKSVSDCYKGFTYNNGAANTTVKAAEGFFILVKVKNVPADATVEMSIKGVE